MGERRWALSVPLDAFALAEHAEIAREAERLGYTGAWSFEIDGVDGFSPLAVVGMATRLRVGIAIANVFTRGPATLAITAAGIAEIAPGRFCLGVGAGSEPIVEAWNGGRFDRPARRVRETVQFLRAALAGERVVFRGETFSVDGFRLSRPLEHPVPLHVAALRPGMLRIAGEVADGVVLNWLSADDVPKSVAVVREAAVKAGRDPKAVEIAARLLVNLDPPGESGDVGVRRYVTAYLNVPVYRAFHEWLGHGAQLGPMWDAWERGDRRAAVAAVPAEVAETLILRGSMAEIRAGVEHYLEAGVDTAFLQFLSSEPDAQAKRARILSAVRALAPA